MALLASTVMLEAGAMLNDPALITYSYAVQLPYLRLAMQELQSKLLENGVSVLDTKTATLALTAVTSVSITSATDPALPADLLLPICLEERQTGTSNLFSPMFEREAVPERPQGLCLTDWCWEEDGIKLVGALVDTDVRVTYQKSLTAITASGDPITVLGAQLFLSTRTAAWIARIIGRNDERAAVLESAAERELQSLLRSRIKEAQDVPVRRLPYGFLRRQLRRSQLRSGR
jgi:hypothetical protein